MLDTIAVSPAVLSTYLLSAMLDTNDTLIVSSPAELTFQQYQEAWQQD